MNNLNDLIQHISRQLNDHKESPHGVEQPTYYTWPETHIKEAVANAASYLYSIFPEAFAVPGCHKLTVSTCVVDLSTVCHKLTSIISVGSGCNNARQRDDGAYNMKQMLQLPCDFSKPENQQLWYYRVLSPKVIQFEQTVPANTVIHFMCASYNGVDALPEHMIIEHGTLLTSFSLWWLLLTDNESRSNPERWQSYYQSVRDYVTLKLNVEFSLRAEDYINGQKLTNRAELDNV